MTNEIITLKESKRVTPNVVFLGYTDEDKDMGYFQFCNITRNDYKKWYQWGCKIRSRDNEYKEVSSISIYHHIQSLIVEDYTINIKNAEGNTLELHDHLINKLDTDEMTFLEDLDSSILDQDNDGSNSVVVITGIGISFQSYDIGIGHRIFSYLLTWDELETLYGSGE